MDLRMPGGDGVGATGQITGRRPATRVLMLTTYETDADILQAVEAGAAGYLLKDATRPELADAVRAAARGETVLAPAVGGLVANGSGTDRSRLSRSCRPARRRSWCAPPAA